MSLSRRHFLALLPALLCPLPDARARPAGGLPGNLFRDRAALQALAGRLRRTPGHWRRRAPALATLLQGGSTPAEPRRQLQGAIADDWRHERLVVVDGWVLSETEACLVQLAAGG